MRKRIMLLTAALCVGILYTPVYAAENVSITESAEYSEITEDADYVISSGVLQKYTGSATEITLPAECTSMVAEAFIGNKTLQKIDMSATGITVIPNGAFHDCSALKEVVFPNSLTSIGDNAFRNTKLGQITLNDGLKKIGFHAFRNALEYFDEYNQPEYVDLIIPGTVTDIYEGAFADNENLRSVKFAEGMSDITYKVNAFSTEYIFGNCKNLKTAELPDRMTRIPVDMFKECKSLTEVKIGNGTQTIDKSAFKDCKSLHLVNFPATVTTISDEAFRNTCLGQITLNDGLKVIGYHAFQNAFNYFDDDNVNEYVDLTIPGTVLELNGSAFADNKNLRSVKFAEGTADITYKTEAFATEYIFANCENLKTAELPDRMTRIPVDMFKECKSLTEVKIGNGAQTIDKSAFKDCKSLHLVNFPATVTTISDEAFRNTCLGQITLNDGLKVIGYHAFQNAFNYFDDNSISEYVDLIIPGTVLELNGSAFADNQNLRSVKFAERRGDITYKIEPFATEYIFANCKNLKIVEIADRITLIPEEMFRGCSSLEEVKLGSGIQTIDKRAFNKCNKLAVINFPDSLTDIKAEAFAECTDLHDVTLNENLKTIGERAFYRCFSYVDKDNKPYYEELVIPARVDTIGNSAFEDCKYLKTVTFKNGTNVKLEMGTGIFSYSESLEEVYLPERLKTLLRETFFKNDNLKTVYIPKSVTSIHEEAFGYNAEEAFEDLTIYSDPDSKAKEFADKKGMHFDNKIKLGFNVTGVELKPASYAFTVEEKAQLAGQSKVFVANVMPATAQNTNVTFESSDKNVATVNAKGVVTPVGFGECYITVKTAEGGFMASSKVTVRRIPSAAWITATKKYIVASNPLKANVDLHKTTEGISLKSPEGTAAVFANNYAIAEGNNKFEVIVSHPDYGEVNLGEVDFTGTRVKSLKIIADDFVMKGDTISANAVLKTYGHDYSDFEFIWSGDGQAVAIKPGVDASQRTLLGIGENATDTISVKVVLKENGVATPTTDDMYQKTWFVREFDVTCYSKQYLDDMDKTPLMEEEGSTIVFNTLKVKPSAYITLHSKLGAKIDPDGFEVYEHGVLNSKYTITPVAGSTYMISYDGTPEKKSEIEIVAKIKNYPDKYRFKVTCDVKAIKPSYAVSSSEILLYKKDAEAAITVISEEEIETLKYEPAVASGPSLVQKSADAATNTVIVGKSSAVNGSNYATTNTKGTLKIHFKGYKPETDVNASITIKSQKTVPVFDAVVSSDTFCVSRGCDYTDITVTDDYGRLASEANGYNLSLKSVTGYQGVDKKDGTLHVTLNSQAKNAKLEVLVSSDDWYTGAQAKINVKTKVAAQPVLYVGAKSFDVNISEDYAGITQYMPLYINGMADASISDFTADISEKERKVFNDAFNMEYKDGKLAVTVKDIIAVQKAKKVTFTGTLTAESGVIVSGKLVINPVKKAPTVSFKNKGSIELLGRTSSQIVAVPTVKGYTGKVVSAKEVGENSSRFTVRSSNGKLYIQAVDGVDINKAKYVLDVKLTMDSGKDILTKINITPKQTNPKITLSTKQITLSATATGVRGGKTVYLSPSLSYVTIESVVVEDKKNDGSFKFEYNEDGGSGVLYYNTGSGNISAGKTYSLKLLVKCAGSDPKAKPISVPIKVKLVK